MHKLRVLDLSRVLAGPLCTMILGDLGANVIKIERPATGDESRGWGPPFDSDGQSAYFLSVNRNKMSVAADFKLEEDRQLVMRLAMSADVVVENFLPAVLGSVGIDRDAILRGNERLIWCTISGFGTESHRPGYDFVVQAECGWMSVTGEASGQPMKAGVALADVIAGKDAVIGIMTRLLARGAAVLSPAERVVNISLADSARSALVNVAQNVMVSGTEASRFGNAHANLVPYQLFEASDRSIVIAVGSDRQWLGCARALQLTELGAREELRTNAGRLAERESITGAIARVVASREASYWLQRLNAEGVACGLVRTVSEAVAGVGASAKSGMPSSVGGGETRLLPPSLDEHGVAVRDRGWDAFR